MAQPIAASEGIFDVDSGPQASSNEYPGILDKAEIERLGRQRPALLKSAWAECGFVFSVVASMMISEFFIGGFFIISPALAESLQIPTALRTWPAAVPNLTTAALLLPCARLCDRYGGRLVFLMGHIWLLIWSIIAGFSQNPTMLIVCRALQGIGSGIFLPAGMALLGQAYRPGPRKNSVFSLYGAFAVIGFYCGIFMGALASQLLDWKWYFWIGAILCLIVTVVGFLTIPRKLGLGNKTAQIDWWGVCTIVPGLVLVVFALTDGGHAPDGWRTPYIYISFILGGIFLCAAVYVQGWVSADPLLPADAFRPKYMKRLVASLFCSYGVFGLYLFYASYYIETVLHTSPFQTAAWFAPLAVGGMILALTGGFVLHLIPGRILLIISGLGYILSVLLFAVMPEQSASGEPSTSFLYWSHVFPAMICGTIGMDISFNVTNVFITTALPARLQATAGALTNCLVYLGIAFWLGVGDLAVATSQDLHGELGLREQYQIGFWTGVGLAALSLCLVATVKMGQAAAEMTADERARAEQEAK
ncbi:major facilitator superfamily domain-containing protein [Pseudomassariella vexata]|uniref:Major facilitator superfamily domain-containing protein n=1 Tax=Pseudomassariella vexata TaxID=1141098 RepID=A0A1Y2E752_9PEZI|nr:major facilitator superfamily domain-containing protein [Pseudomassariella vexata]ORY67381.1 major facilitator superfamily domain-containing protein [Pseudomassariella vexata]